MAQCRFKVGPFSGSRSVNSLGVTLAIITLEAIAPAALVAIAFGGLVH